MRGLSFIDRQVICFKLAFHIKDIYGLALTKDLYGGAGNLVWGSTLPEVEEELKAPSNMFYAGQLDKEFGVKDGGKVAESIAASKIGIDFGAQWHPMYPLISNFQNDPDANF